MTTRYAKCLSLSKCLERFCFIFFSEKEPFTFTLLRKMYPDASLVGLVAGVFLLVGWLVGWLVGLLVSWLVVGWYRQTDTPNMNQHINQNIEQTY